MRQQILFIVYRRHVHFMEAFHPDTDIRVLIQLFPSITNKMQHYTIFFITVNALHVSGGFSARITFGVCAWPRTHTKRYAAALPQITSTILKTYKIF